ncbi:MAG: ACT domain-containing protein [Candidatus Brocadiaceae bacterium]|jgi:hypothetical protein
MQVMKQLSIFLENKPGTLAEVCDALSQRGINLLALTCVDAVDHAVVRLVPDMPDAAAHVLGNAGMLVVENDVLMLEVPNEPGSLGEVAAQLAQHELNIEYAYCTVSADQPTGALVLRTRDGERAMEVLSSD